MERVGLVSLEQSSVIFNSDIMLFQTLPSPPSTSSRASLRDFHTNSPSAISRATEEPRMRTTKMPPTLANPSSAALAAVLLPSSYYRMTYYLLLDHILFASISSLYFIIKENVSLDWLCRLLLLSSRSTISFSKWWSDWFPAFSERLGWGQRGTAILGWKCLKKYIKCG